MEKLQLVVMASAACSCPSTATCRGCGMTKHDVGFGLGGTSNFTPARTDIAEFAIIKIHKL